MKKNVLLLIVCTQNPPAVGEKELFARKTFPPLGRRNCLHAMPLFGNVSLRFLRFRSGVWEVVGRGDAHYLAEIAVERRLGVEAA